MKKIPIIIKKLKGSLGETHFNENGKAVKIYINRKAHKGDKAELASTVKHEMLHAKNPNMKEKTVYKRSRKTKMSDAEKAKYIAMIHKKRTII